LELQEYKHPAQAQEKEEAKSMQASLLVQPLRPLDPPEFVFGYKYTSGGKPHTHTIQDWEVQAAYIAYCSAIRPATRR
jgi:hypothetical protein